MFQLTLKGFIIIIIIILILLILSKFENKLNQSNKQSFKTPNTYIKAKLKDGDEILIYAKSHEKDIEQFKNNYKYSYDPKVLISTRLNKPFKESFETFKNIDKDSIITDTVGSVIPLLTYSNSLFNFNSGYKVLSNLDNLKVTSDENMIYIKESGEKKDEKKDEKKGKLEK